MAEHSAVIATYDDLTAERLAALGFDDPAQAARRLQDLAGHDVPDANFERLLPLLARSLVQSADPDRAVANFAAWLEHVGSRTLYYTLLADNPAALDALLTIFAASQFLSDLLIQTPEYFEVIANAAIRDRKRTLDDYLSDARRRVAVAKTVRAKRDALRRFKPPEVLRIGARDLLGYASVTETVQEISDFAEACVRVAVEICDAGGGFVVIALGKLGGRELNYASDIDLMFVHADSLSQTEANARAEAVRDTLATQTDAGFLFRVDLRLRPEGRFGPLSRSVSGCRAYYESWAENWERQALLKARPIAGDAVTGSNFQRIADAFVFPGRVTETFLEDLRASKRLLERSTQRAGESETNVKQGVGAIRDIEFTVQCLQLLAGGEHRELRTGNTQQSLDALAQLSLITPAERDTLSHAYWFLRDVEHRLQIMDERPVRNLPIDNPRELEKFARRLGYADGPEFLATYRQQTALVSALFREVFYGRTSGNDRPRNQEYDDNIVSEWVRTIDAPDSQAKIADVLTAQGFQQPAEAIALLRKAQVGNEYGTVTPEAGAIAAELAFTLIGAAAATPAPDDALRAVDSLSEAMPSRAAFDQFLLQNQSLLKRLCVLAVSSPPLWQTLTQRPEYLDMLSDEAHLARPADSPLPTPIDIAAFVRRERLRLGASDLWDLMQISETLAQTTRVAEIAIAAALRSVGSPETGLAVIGLGKLGGAELNYGSDLDVLWVASEDLDNADATRLAEQAMRLLKDGLKPYAVSYEIDTRLRPGGRYGRLVRTIDEYLAYYETTAETWEKQAILKARFVAGDTKLGNAYLERVHALIYQSPVSETQMIEMRAMKSRIENERSKGDGDIKLGSGGLSDIEWMAQRLQWAWGARWPRAQTPNTIAALTALRDAGVVRQDDWELLTETYLALATARNRAWLRAGRNNDLPPLSAELTQRRVRVRIVFERLFLGTLPEI